MVTQPARRSGKFHAAVIAGAAPLALAMFAGGGTPPGAACGVECGHERWTVKTMSDPGARAVMQTAPQPATVSSLVAQRAPLDKAGETRASDLEKQIYTVTADLVGFKQEKDDHDFHIVIRDQKNPADTMIVEIPDTACSGVCASVAHDEIAAARTTFAAAFAGTPPNPTFRTLAHPIQVTITGVPLFDFFHRQTGVAKNCIELHPVLTITLPSGTIDATEDQSKEPKNGKDSDYTCVPKATE